MPAVRSYLPFVVAGLASGSAYALAALGLVLTYRTSGVFNFAHGALATVGAYAFYELWSQNGVPWPIAALVSLVVASVVLGLALAAMASGLRYVGTAMKVVATVGVLLIIQGVIVLRYGAQTRFVNAFLPTGSVRLAGVEVGVDQLIIIGIGAAAAAGLYVFLRFSRLGRAMRGVVDSPDLLELSGISPERVRRWSWIMGTAFAAGSGILLAPQLGVDAVLLTLLVVQAFGAAALGGFTSLPLTYAGGLAVGIGASLATKFTATHPALAGVPSSFPFAVLFVALVVLGLTGRLRRTQKDEQRPPATRLQDFDRRSIPVGVVVLVGLAVIPSVVGARLPVYSSALVYTIVFLSLALLVQTSGQLSLAHISFLAIGASTFARLAGGGADVPWLFAVVLAGLAAVPVGALISVPAIRLSGVYLAAATFGFGIVLQRLVYETTVMFGKGANLPAPRPGVSFLSSDESYYYLLLGFVVVVTVGIVAVHRGRLGRLLRAMADAPDALQSLGTSVNVTRLIVFCLSAFLAAVAGALLASMQRYVSGTGFQPLNSLLLLVVLVLGGRRPIVSSFAAAAMFAVVPAYIRDRTLIDALPVLFGAGALVAALGPVWGERVSGWARRVNQASTDRSRYRVLDERVDRRRAAVETAP